MKITYLGKLLQLRQRHWMTSFVDLYTRVRRNSGKKFLENSYKLIDNSAFGEAMESRVERKKMEIGRNERELLQKSALGTMRSF